MKKMYLLFLFSFLFVSSIRPQENLLPEGVSFSNQMKYSLDTKKDLEIFEDWLNLDYRKGIFSAGLRLETYQPNDPNPSISRYKDRFSDINYKYLRFDLEGANSNFSITAGNYYALFGRGLTLKSYEDRNVRIDNNLLGMKLEGNYKDLYFKALSGMPANFADVRENILHGADLEFRGLKYLTTGMSFVSNLPPNGKSRDMLAAFRAAPRFDNFDMYFEGGARFNKDIKDAALQDVPIAGRAVYANLNYYLGALSISTEYKLYDNFGLRTSDLSTDYNTPPSLRKDYAYILPNRHPSALNADNEQGAQVELTYGMSEKTFINLNYAKTASLSSRSLYQRSRNLNLPVQDLLDEVWFQVNHELNDKFHLAAGLGYKKELATNTESFTPIFDIKYFIDDYNAVRGIFEHQQTTDNLTSEKYFDDVLLLEYTNSPDLSISLVSEMLTTEPLPGNRVRRMWNFIQFGYQLAEHTDLSVLIGSRQAGNICIGGVCRYEPEFRGIEIRMQNRLY